MVELGLGFPAVEMELRRRRIKVLADDNRAPGFILGADLARLVCTRGEIGCPANGFCSGLSSYTAIADGFSGRQLVCWQMRMLSSSSYSGEGFVDSRLMISVRWRWSTTTALATQPMLWSSTAERKVDLARTAVVGAHHYWRA